MVVIAKKIKHNPKQIRTTTCYQRKDSCVLFMDEFLCHFRDLKTGFQWRHVDRGKLNSTHGDFFEPSKQGKFAIDQYFGEVALK